MSHELEHGPRYYMQSGAKETGAHFVLDYLQMLLALAGWPQLYLTADYSGKGLIIGLAVGGAMLTWGEFCIGLSE